MQFIDLKKQYEVLKEEIDSNIQECLDEGSYIMGSHVKKLEEELAKYVGRKHCISCANGTDALSLVLMAWGVKEGDAVFVPSFTFYSTSEVVSLLNAEPIFVDVDERTFNIDPDKLEKAILQVKEEGKLNPKAIIPVDLFGQCADYDRILEIAKKHDLFVLEDGAQGFGGSINGKKACSFGDASTTSFFPAKPLGCYGDGGAIFTDDDELAELLRSLRVHGKGEFKYDNVRVGMNSRLDTLQAAILLPKLKAFKEYELEKRNEVAKLYDEMLKDRFMVPFVPEGYVSSWAQYTLILESRGERKRIQEYLKKEGIPTMVYYPKPLHKQAVYKDYGFNLEDLKVSESLAERVLSIPMHPYMEKEDVKKVCKALVEIKND